MDLRDGVVTLTGFVHIIMRSSPQRARKLVYGVKGLGKDIQVRSGVRTDPEITKDVVHALGVNVTLPENRMIGTVKDAYVTLDVSLMIDEALKGNAETDAPALQWSRPTAR